MSVLSEFVQLSGCHSHVRMVWLFTYTGFEFAVVATWRNGEGVPPLALGQRRRGSALQVDAQEEIG